MFPNHAGPGQSQGELFCVTLLSTPDGSTPTPLLVPTLRPIHPLLRYPSGKTRQASASLARETPHWYTQQESGSSSVLVPADHVPRMSWSTRAGVQGEMGGRDLTTWLAEAGAASYESAIKVQNCLMAVSSRQCFCLSSWLLCC